MKCNQSGKHFKVKTVALSTADSEPLTLMKELEKGTQLLLDINKKSYPVTVIKVTDGKIGTWHIDKIIEANTHLCMYREQQ